MGRVKGYQPYAIMAILFWSLAYVLTRLALRYFTAFSLGFLRYGVASIVLLAVCVIKKIKPPQKKDIPWFLVSGASGFFLYMIVFNIGTGYVSAATSSVIIASVPVFTALLASAVFKERLKRYQWAAIAVEFAGILVLTMVGAVFSLNIGSVWLLTAALLLSVYNILQRKLTRRYTALQATAYSIFAGTAMLAIFSPGALREIAAAPPEQMLYILLMGVFSSAAAYIAWSKAFSLAAHTSQVSNYMFFTPLVTGILGFWLAGETPDSATWIGGALILLGSLWFNRENLHRR